MENEVLEIYRPSSDVMIKGSNERVVIEKVIIGDKNSISYRVVSYIPERHQLQVNEYEIQPIQDKTTTQQMGFQNGVAKQEVKIFVDKDNQLIGVDDEAVSPLVFQLNDEEVKAMSTLTTPICADEEVKVEKKPKKKVKDEEKTEKKKKS